MSYVETDEGGNKQIERGRYCRVRVRERKINGRLITTQRSGFCLGNTSCASLFLLSLGNW